MAELDKRYWFERNDFGTGTGTIAGANTFSFSGALTRGVTFPATTDPFLLVGNAGPIHGWFAYSYGGTDSDVAVTLSLLVRPQQSGFFFSNATASIFSTAIASGVTAALVTYNAATAATLTGHVAYADVRITASKTAAGAATLTYGAGLGLAAF